MTLSITLAVLPLLNPSDKSLTIVTWEVLGGYKIVRASRHFLLLLLLTQDTTAFTHNEVSHLVKVFVLSTANHLWRSYMVKL